MANSIILTAIIWRLMEKPATLDKPNGFMIVMLWDKLPFSLTKKTI